MDGTIRSKEDPEYERKAQQYNMLTTMFATDHRDWKDNVKHWKANKYRMFEKLLQHFPKDFFQRLKSNGMYNAVNYSKDFIALITIIRDVPHQHDDTTRGTMALVTSDMDIYTTFMTSEDDTEEFMLRLTL